FQRFPAQCPDCLCRSSSRLSSARTSSIRASPGGKTRSSSTSDQPDSSWQSKHAEHIRESEKPLQVCRTVPATSHHSPVLSASVQWHRKPASCAQPDQFHHIQLSHPGVQLPADQDCSSTFSKPLPDATPYN